MGASVFKSEKRIRYALIGVFLTIAGAVACVLPSTAFAAWSTTNISDMNSQRTSSVYFNRNYNYYDNAVVTMGSGVSMVTSSEWPGSHNYVKSYVVSNAHGTTTNPLTIKLPGYGYTVEGKSVDMLITITSVYMEGDAFSGDDSNNYFLEIAKGKLDPNYPVDGWICLDSPAWWRTEIKFNIKLYYAGTNTLVPNTIRGTTASYLYEFNDLDAVNAILHGSPGNWSYEYSTSWYEQITRRGSNFEDVAYRYSNGSVVYTSDNATYRAKADSEGGHGTGDYDDEGTILFHGRNNADFTWRGVGCGTLLGIAGQVKTYPNFTAPVKTPATQTKKKGETCSAFVIDQWLPAVSPDNKPSSIVVTDVFDNAFDITGATGKVTKDGIDVSSSWTFAKNGQTVTFTAKSTAHGGNAEGDLKFTISGVKVKSNANLSSYSTTTDSSSGRTCWVIKNTASTKVTATYGGGTKTTPPVNVLVPQPANVIYQYVGNVHPQDEPAVPTVAANTYFIGDNYTAAAAVSDSHNQYNFLGWYSDSACTTKWPASGKKLTAATTYLYGKWEPKPVNITYHYVGDYHPSPEPALPTEPANTWYIDQTYTAKPVVVDSTGNYDFAGWYSDEACTTKWPAAGKKLTNVSTHLYGKWIPRPRIAPSKTANPAKYNINDTVTYTVIASQTVQGATTSGVTLTDKLNQSGDIIADGASYVANSIVIKNNAGTDITSSCTITWASDGKSFTAVIPATLSYAQKVTMTYKVKLGNTTTKALQGKSYTNRVTATCNNQATPQSSTPLTSDFTIYVRKPKLAATKTVDDNFVDAGDTVTYTMTAKNTGEADSVAFGVKFTDVYQNNELFANGATITSVVVKDGDGATVEATHALNSDNKTITITPNSRLDLAAGKTATATVKIKLGNRSSVALSGKVYKNTVTASSNNTDDATADAQIEVSDPKLEATKTALDPKLNVSESGKLRVELRNTTQGSKAYNVSVTDTMEAATVERGGYIDASTIKVTNNAGTDITSSATITTTQTNGKVSGFKVATTEALGYNEILTVEYKEVAGTTTSVDLQTKNMVNSVYGEATNSTEHSSTATAQIYVREPKMNATKSVNDTYVDAGDTVTYTLTATNSGGDADSIAFNVKMTDAFPAQLLADGATVDLSGIVVKDHNNSTVSCTPTMNGNNLIISTDVDLPDGGTMTATVPVKLGDRGNVMSGRTYENTLTDSSDNSNTATATARIEVSDPVLKTTKTATEDFVNTSERAHFTITGTNTTDGSVAYDISFTDRLTDSAAAAGAWIDLSTLNFIMPDGSVLAPSEYTVTPVTKQGLVSGFDIKSSCTLAAGEVITLTFDVVAGETTSIDLQDTAIPNTARVNATNSKNPGNQASDTVEIYTPELTIIKETTMPVANVADHVPYKITVEQVVEGAIAWNIHLTDDIQPEFAALGGVWDMGSFHVMDQHDADRVSECGFYTNSDKSRLDITTPISLGYHEKMTVLYDVIFGETTTRELQGHDYTNIVTANADNTRQDVTDDATVHVPVPHAKATKTIDKPVVNVTDRVVYTLVAENDGEDGSCLRNVTFTDVMPAKFIEAGAVVDKANITATQGGQSLAITPVVEGNKITIATGQSLYKGDNITVLVPVIVGNRASWELCGATWQNVLTVSTDNTDPAEDTAEVTVLKPDLNLVKTPGVEIANVSDRIDYKVVATNLAEGSLAFDPTITDELAELAVAEHAYIDQSTIKIEHSNGTNLTGAATITWKLNEEGQAIGYTALVPCDISDADSLTITYTAVAGKTTSQELMKEGMDNEVEGTLANDPDPRDDTATVAFYTPVLEIIKEADAKYLNAGDTAGYTLTVRQLENGAIAWNVVIEDMLNQDAFERGAYMLADSWKMFYDGEQVDPAGIEWTDLTEVEVEPADDEHVTPAVKEDGDEGGEDVDTQSEQNRNLMDAEPTSNEGEGADQGSEPGGEQGAEGSETESDDEPVVPDGPEKRARGFVTATGIDLAAEHEIKITYDVKAGTYDVNTLSGTDIENIARATGDNVPVPAETFNVIPVLFPHLAVEKTADRHQISTFEEIEYKVAAEVTEENAIAHDVVFEDTFTWAGAEGAIDVDKIAKSIVVDLDGKALELEASGISVEGTWQNGEGTIKIHVETATALPYGSVMTMTYDVMFGEREANAPVIAQVIDNLATVSCSNGDQAQDDEQIEILDAELTIDKKGVSQGPANIFYEVDVAQVRENAIARDVVITDRLSDGAVVAGVSLNKDVVVFGPDGSVLDAKITYIEVGSQVVGYTAEVGDLAFNEGVKVAYSSNASLLGFGLTEVVNTAIASALNAPAVADTEAFSFDGGVAPDLIQTGDGQDPAVLAGFIALTAAAAASASVARRRRR